MKLDSLETLLIEELRDLYNAERQILKALPKMAKAASSTGLQKGFQEHLQQTQTQVKCLDKIFTDLGSRQKARSVKPWKGCSRKVLSS